MTDQEYYSSKPDALILRLKDYTTKLELSLGKEDYHKMVSYLGYINMVIGKLRSAYKDDNLTEMQIKEIKVLINSATIENAKVIRRQKLSQSHKIHFFKKGLHYPGTRLSTQSNIRVTHCFACKRELDSSIDLECVGCGWIVCSCGACGCLKRFNLV